MRISINILFMSIAYYKNNENLSPNHFSNDSLQLPYHINGVCRTTQDEVDVIFLSFVFSIMRNIIPFAGFLFIFINTIFSMRIQDYFEANQIVPEIIPVSPKKRCKVTYPNGTIQTGVMYPRKFLIKEPEVTWDCNPGALYAVIMTCVDEIYEGKPYTDEIHWWLVVNIRSCNINKGETVFNYAMINRQPMDGAHRVVIFVYKQPIYYNYEIISERSNDTKISIRRSITIRALADKLIWGDPVAGNAFRIAN